MNDLNPDILHAHFVTKWGWLAALSGFHPLVLTPWGSDLFIDAEKSTYHRLLTRYTLKNADLITANSQTLRKQACVLGADPACTFIIQDGINLKRFKKVDSKSLEEKLNIPMGVPVIFSPRMMKPVYNIETVIRVLSAVHEHQPDAVFIIVNYPKNDYAKKIKNKIIEADIIEQVRLVDCIPNSDMPKYYSLADVTLSIPLSDSTASSVLEAMACGSVPVVSNLPALREMITEGESGYLVSPLHFSEIARKISDILNNSQDTHEISKHNMQRVKEIANQEFWMGEMERLYKTILERHYATQ